MSVKVIKSNEPQAANVFAPPSQTRTNRPVQFVPTPAATVLRNSALGKPAEKTPAELEAEARAKAEAEAAVAAERLRQERERSQTDAEQLASAAKQAAAIIAEADARRGKAFAEADQMVAEAKARVAEIERTAREKGRAEAQAQAQVALDRAVADLRTQLTNSLDEVAQLRVTMAARAEQDLVRLALAIAQKIVQREVRVDHEIALTLTRVALSRIHSRAGAVVRLHPDDYAYALAHRERLAGETAIELVEDRSVGPGGCIVQSEMGEIDARIEQQFAEIEQDFLGA